MALHAFSRCQLVTFPRRRRGGDARGAALLTALVYLAAAHEGRTAVTSRSREGADCKSTARDHPRLTGCPLFNEVPPFSSPQGHPVPRQAPAFPPRCLVWAAEMLIHGAQHGQHRGGRRGAPAEAAASAPCCPCATPGAFTPVISANAATQRRCRLIRSALFS